jgi:hypothetical protein
LWTHVGQIDRFWMSLKEIEPGAVSRLAQLARARRHDVIFLTQRPPSAGPPAQLQSQRWLDGAGFELPSVYVVNGSRGRVASALALDVVIDDRPENCVDVVTRSRARAILIWRGDRAAAPPGAARVGIELVFSMGEALDRLDMPRPARVEPQPRLLGRVREAFGI